eukprot:CAMPEP_0170242676 /NCGR_PEP_ID=MMETSP0116_2-20130129/21110_1 /TAXON_ID=400756 /ORGANISM="Durinskia baltica, Strain CSIRO CS-38" /LENGTH=1614 /DNA_ID=CAMNT_0010493523 /DNA_START=24 /DNA_END=4866 /DNA_ORIENTATION=+
MSLALACACMLSPVVGALALLIANPLQSAKVERPRGADDMQPRTRAERHREASLAAAVGGHAADEAVQREWDAQCRRKEQERLFDKLQDQVDNVKQLEQVAKAYGDEALLQQAEAQRRAMDAEQRRHGMVPRASTSNGRPAEFSTSNNGGVGIPAPAAFEIPTCSCDCDGSSAPPVAPGPNLGLFGAACGSDAKRVGLFGLPQSPAVVACNSVAPSWNSPDGPKHDPIVHLQARQSFNQPVSGAAVPAAPAHTQLAELGAALLPPQTLVAPRPPPLDNSRESNLVLRREDFLRRRQQQSASSIGNSMGTSPISVPPPMPVQHAPSLAGAVMPSWHPMGHMGARETKELVEQSAPPTGIHSAQCQGLECGSFPTGVSGSVDPQSPWLPEAPRVPLVAPSSTAIEPPLNSAIFTGQDGCGNISPSGGGDGSASIPMRAEGIYDEEVRWPGEDDRLRQCIRHSGDGCGTVPSSLAALASGIDPYSNGTRGNGNGAGSEQNSEKLRLPAGLPGASGGGLFDGLGRDVAKRQEVMKRQQQDDYRQFLQQRQQQQQHPGDGGQQWQHQQQQCQQNWQVQQQLQHEHGQPHQRLQENPLRHGLPQVGLAPDVPHDLREHDVAGHAAACARPPLPPPNLACVVGAFSSNAIAAPTPCQIPPFGPKDADPDAPGGIPTTVGGRGVGSFVQFGAQGDSIQEQRRRKQDEHKRILQEQIAEKQRQRAQEEQRRKAEEERELELIIKEKQLEEQRWREEQAREMEKRSALQRDNSANVASGSLAVCTDGQARLRFAHGKSEIHPKEQDVLANAPEPVESMPVPRPDLFGPAPVLDTCPNGEFFGAPAALRHPNDPFDGAPIPFAHVASPLVAGDRALSIQANAAPAPQKPTASSPSGPQAWPAKAGGELATDVLHGLLMQQQEMYRHQHEALAQLQDEAQRLRHEKDAAKQDLLDLKAKQVEAKEQEVIALRKRLQRQLLLHGGNADVNTAMLGLSAASCGSNASEAGLSVQAHPTGHKPVGSCFYSKYEIDSTHLAKEEFPLVRDSILPASGQQGNEAIIVHRHPGSEELRVGTALFVPVTEANDEPNAQEDGWSVAQVPWLASEADNLCSEHIRAACEMTEMGCCIDAKSTGRLEDSLFDESWKRVVLDENGNPNLDGAIVTSINECVGRPEECEKASSAENGRVDASMSFCITLAGDSTFVPADVACAPPVLDDSVVHHARSVTVTTGQLQVQVPAIPSGTEAQPRIGITDSADDCEVRPTAPHAPLDLLQDAVDGMRQLRLRSAANDVNLDATTDSSKTSTSMSLWPSASSALPRTRNNGMHISLDDGASDGQVVSSGESWGNILRKFGCRDSVDASGSPQDESPQREAADSTCRRALQCTLSNEVLKEVSLVDPSCAPATCPGFQHSLHAAAETDSVVEANSDVATPFTCDDFAAFAAADPEDFESFIARLQCKVPAGSPSSASDHILPSGCCEAAAVPSSFDPGMTASLHSTGDAALRSIHCDGLYSTPRSRPPVCPCAKAGGTSGMAVAGQLSPGMHGGTDCRPSSGLRSKGRVRTSSPAIRSAAAAILVGGRRKAVTTRPRTWRGLAHPADTHLRVRGGGSYLCEICGLFDGGLERTR